jgi:hypothetical protein
MLIDILVPAANIFPLIAYVHRICKGAVLHGDTVRAELIWVDEN